MWRLAFGVFEGQCAGPVLDAAPDNFPCYDMASSLLGDFVADGEVTVHDLGLHIRMLYGSIDMPSSYMRLSNTVAWKYRVAEDCSRRRERQMETSIVKSWTVTCPDSLDTCHYDCSDHPSCMASIAPAHEARLDQGSWWSIPLPERVP